MIGTRFARFSFLRRNTQHRVPTHETTHVSSDGSVRHGCG
jgi:hypothetical protein